MQFTTLAFPTTSLDAVNHVDALAVIRSNSMMSAFVNPTISLAFDFWRNPTTQLVIEPIRWSIKTHQSIVAWLDADSSTTEGTNRDDVIALIKSLAELVWFCLIIIGRYAKQAIDLIDAYVIASQETEAVIELPATVEAVIQVPAAEEPTISVNAKKVEAVEAVIATTPIVDYEAMTKSQLAAEFGVSARQTKAKMIREILAR